MKRIASNLLIRNKSKSIATNSFRFGSKISPNWSQISRKNLLFENSSKLDWNNTFTTSAFKNQRTISTSSNLFSSSHQNNNGNANHRQRSSSKHAKESETIKPISIFSLNCFLVPNLFTLRKVNEGCRDQEPRAQDISRIAKHHPLVILQEVWGPGLEHFRTILGETHSFTPSISSISVFSQPDGSFLQTLVDSSMLWLKSSGGLLIGFQTSMFQLLHSSHSTFKVSESSSRKGVQVALLNAEQFWGKGKSLLIFNTHVDPRNVSNRGQQLRQIKSFMDQTISQIRKQELVDTNQMAVIVTGDFNIASEWKEEYSTMMSILGDGGVKVDNSIHHKNEPIVEESQNESQQQSQSTPPTPTSTPTPTTTILDLYKEHCQRENLPELNTYDTENPLSVHSMKMLSRRIDYVLALNQPSKHLSVTTTDYRVLTNLQLSDHYAQVLSLVPKQ